MLTRSVTVRSRCAGSGESLLAPGFVDHHGHGIGQIEAAARRAHGDLQQLLGRQAVANLRGQATTFRAKEEYVTGQIVHFGIAVASLGGERQNPAAADSCDTVDQAVMAFQCRVFVIVQPGAAQALVIQLETQWLDQVQLAAGVGTQADDVAGIGRDFRLEQHDMKHNKRPGHRLRQGAWRISQQQHLSEEPFYHLSHQYTHVR